jgi:hypothetical protein
MRDVFIGSAALASGRLTRAQLRWNYCPLFPDVYLSKVVAPSLRLRTVGAWLWSGRDGVIAGRAAAALQGALWIDAATPIEMIWRCGRPPNGIAVRNERIDAEDIMMIDGIPVTTPERAAFDIARHLPRDLAVRHLDALARATGVKATDVQLLGERYPRARGLPRSRIAVPLMDGGAESPQETRVRLKVGFDYDGEQHQTNRDRYVHDIGRAELLDREGWIDIKVVAEHSRQFILHRARAAFARRRWIPPKLH